MRQADLYFMAGRKGKELNRQCGTVGRRDREEASVGGGTDKWVEVGVHFQWCSGKPLLIVHVIHKNMPFDDTG